MKSKRIESNDTVPGAAWEGVIVGIGAQTGAVVVGPDPGEGCVWVERGQTRHRAKLAVAGPYQPQIGDGVVVVGGGEQHFVVGVVGAARELVANDGATASLDADGRLELRDADGSLVVRRSDEETTVFAAAGDLVLDAPDGAVSIRAKTNVVLEAEGEIQQRAHRIDVQAEELFERTRDSIREVSSLLLTRAGRVRSVVREGFSLMSKRTVMKSKKETSIDGKRILLG